MQAGKIRSELPEGQKRGRRYNLDDCALFLQRMAPAHLRIVPTPPSTPVETATFHIATPDDLPELAVLIEEIFGDAVNQPLWRERMQRNREVGFLLREGSTGAGRVVGCYFMHPHTKEHVREILAQYAPVVSQPEDILSYEAGTSVNLYLRTVGITPSVSKKQKRHWGAILVRNYMRFIEELGQRGVIIENIWSRSETKDGINILSHMGFTQIEGTGNYRNFFIDVPLSGLPMIMSYKRAYGEWQRKNSGD
jgi:hypothetical protein